MQLEKVTSSSHSSALPVATSYPFSKEIWFDVDIYIGTVETIAMCALGNKDDLELVKSMMPRKISIERIAEHGYRIEMCDMIDRIKWRKKQAMEFGVPFEIFRDEYIDQNTKSDDLKLIEMHMNKKSPEKQRRCVVSQKQLSKIMYRYNVGRSEKTIQRWEAYLDTKGTKGQKPPGNFTLKTRSTLQSAICWVESFAGEEKHRLNTKIAFAGVESRQYRR